MGAMATAFPLVELGSLDYYCSNCLPIPLPPVLDKVFKINSLAPDLVCKVFILNTFPVKYSKRLP